MKGQITSLNAPKVLLSVLAVLLTTLVCATFLPNQAHADGAVAHSIDASGKQTDYQTIGDAIRAGYADKEIVMDCDWIADGTIGIESNKYITINMNGHKITNTCSRNVIRLNEAAHLTLTSSTKTEIAYKGYVNGDGKQVDTSVTSGGLVTGADVGEDIAGGIWMGDHTTLTLDNVAVAGNSGGMGGGVRIDKESKMFMKNGAIIQHNKSKSGGGIRVEKNDSNIYMETASSINNNYAEDFGGGIYSDDSATRISVSGNSGINSNSARFGGGAYFNYSYCNIISDDKTGSLSNNVARDGWGGAIFLKEYRLRSNESEFRGLTIDRNCSGYQAGGIYLDQRWSKVVDCTITNNSAAESGGGIYVNGDDNSLINCTITGNTCSPMYGGGGVYVDSDCDITLGGKMIIKDNHTRKTVWTPTEYANDLLLKNGAFTNAYIKGSVDAGSKVGVYTMVNKDRCIAKNVTSYTEGTYFLNESGFYISRGSDEGGDLWQRKL